MSDAEKTQEFEALIEFIKQNRGFDFAGYKSTGLMRRVEKRMQAVGLVRFNDYIDYLEVHPEEFALLQRHSHQCHQLLSRSAGVGISRPRGAAADYRAEGQ